MIDKAITRFGIGLALLLMVSELTYINTKSLMYMVNGLADYDRYFAVIGSLAYSIVTIVIMRTSERKWPKIVFPLFDVALVFCGFNLQYYDAIMAGTDNMVRFYLSIFLASFTGFITYCLGIINYEKYVKSDSDESEGKMTELVRKLDVSESKFYAMKSDFDKCKSDLEKYKSDLAESKTDLETRQSKIAEIQSELKACKSDLVNYRKSHLLNERSRILKKKEENRTPEELGILQESEVLLNAN